MQEQAEKLIRVVATDRGKTFELWLVLPSGERTYLGSTYDRHAAEGCLRLHFVHLVSSILEVGKQLAKEQRNG